MTTTEHPFAQYIRALGKGPNLSRPLTMAETREAARMMLAGEIEPVQLGAFLCLLRVKTESADEMAGFADAARSFITVPASAPAVDLDWPTYAGKSRRLPFYIVSALLLARSGYKVFMHGAEGHTGGRIYASEALTALGVPVATSTDQAARQLSANNFAYMKLADLCPPLHTIMGLRSLLGLRSPIHSVARMLNPFHAAAEIIGVAHPHYRPVHQEAGQLLKQPALAVIKGEGGEAERRPEKEAVVFTLRGDEMRQDDWPPLAVEVPPAFDDKLNVALLRALWTGEAVDAYAEAIVTSTAAVALKLMGKAHGYDEAIALARKLWDERPR
jgi:anthranilate phosphoribosyltransferase